MAAAAAASAFLLFIAALLVPPASSSAVETAAAGPYDPPTVRDLMDRYGLPRALLPDTARRYLLHDDGSFQLFLDDGCVAEAGGYRVGYGIKISGTVAPGRVTGLEGVRVRVLFAWVPVTGVEIGGGEVTVSLGPFRKSFPVVGFKSSPRCIAGAAATPATTDC